MCAFLYPTGEIAGATWIGEYFGDTMLVNGKLVGEEKSSSEGLRGANALPPGARPALRSSRFAGETV
jgi:hypothetical protein